MSIKNVKTAGWAVHPGVILKTEFLDPNDITPNHLAKELHVAAPTVNQIVLQRSGISAEMASRLAKYFGTTEQFWLNLQDAFAVHDFKRKNGKKLEAIKPLMAGAGR